VSKHPIVHVEFSAKDRKVSQKFYSDVFGWGYTHYDDMHYTTFQAAEGLSGGLNEVGEKYPVGTTMVYIETDDVTASLKAVEAAGGTIVEAEYEIPSVGNFGVFLDPAGNKLGLVKWAPMPAGAE
jgi:uncharacterized protein